MASIHSLPDVIVVHICVSVMLAFGDECTTSEKVDYNTQCNPNSCTQGLRYKGDSYFDCTIQLCQGWLEFKQTNNVLESYEQTAYSRQMNPPSLTAVGLYLIVDTGTGKVNNPTLNFTFALPKHNSIDTKGILVNFKSRSDDPLADPFYRDYPRLRFFSFPFYKTPKNDSSSPRKINYKCFMGLDERYTKRVYLMTLTAFTQNPQLPGSSVTYTITSYNGRFETNSLKLTTAVAYFPRLRSLHVIYEALPDQHVLSATFYIIRLFSPNNVLINSTVSKHSNGTSEHFFTGIREGAYMIEVESRQCKRIVCPISHSGIITVQHEEEEEPAESKEKIYTGAGIAGGIGLLIVLLLCVYFSKGQSCTVGITVFCPCPDEKHRNVATAIQEYLERDKHFSPSIIHKESWEANLVLHIHLVVVCRFVCVENIKLFGQNWRVQNTTKCSKVGRSTFVCFSEYGVEPLESVPCLDAWFQWRCGCQHLLKFMQRHCRCTLQAMLNKLFVRKNPKILRTMNSLQEIIDTLGNSNPGNVSSNGQMCLQNDHLSQPLLLKETCLGHENNIVVQDEYQSTELNLLNAGANRTINERMIELNETCL